jgi:hypothetical protein
MTTNPPANKYAFGGQPELVESTLGLTVLESVTEGSLCQHRGATPAFVSIVMTSWSFTNSFAAGGLAYR